MRERRSYSQELSLSLIHDGIMTTLMALHSLAPVSTYSTYIHIDHECVNKEKSIQSKQ